IRDQATRRDAVDDVKLGPGGIREIEFTVQAQQIVRGGRERALRVRNTREALRALCERDCLPQSAADALDRAYVFLRETEHRLQYRDDAQTQALPTEPVELAALARSMRFQDERAFRAVLDEHRREAGHQFASVFGERDDGAPQARTMAWSRLWESPVADEANLAALAAAGYDDPPSLVAMLARSRAGTRYATLPAASRQRFDLLVPQMLAVAAAYPGP